ncbi:MAG: RNA polymerase factor sigma-54 [Candidatus Delongbacteria bacterium]|jgi:RNA polymerase sigma-54 factor|nr:RNA polymerase factor sigma-54 [Candidatus Delongbacteria bacterium]
MLNQRLQQKLQQKLSPQQIQMIKLLELPGLQLQQRVEKELEENPALEEGNESNEAESIEATEQESQADEEFSLDDYVADDDIPDYKLTAHNYSKDDEAKDIPVSDGQSFLDNLRAQLSLKDIDDETYIQANYLLGSLDENGYLRRELDSIVDDLAFSQNVIIEKDELEKALKVAQSLDPPGVGARSLQECLLIQLRRKEIQTPLTELAIKIIETQFEAFTKKHYSKIIDKLKIDEEALKDTIGIIRKLNPKPGVSGSGSRSLQTILPDFIVNIKNGEIEISLTSRNAPELHVSQTYSDMIRGYKQNKKRTKKDKEAMMFVKQKLDAAKWFIDAIKQRQNTLLLTMEAIVKHQYRFFIEGDESALKPMILKDIADSTGLDISTISRVANSKFVQTPYGNYLLKYFFSESIAKENGEEVSTREVKNILLDLIANEDKQKPLTDEKLAELLKQKGYKIARRTIAKYREQLNIPVGRLRKEL